MKFADIIVGETYGRLTIKRKFSEKIKNRCYNKCECCCSCGNIIIVRSDAISGHTMSCGCLNKDRVRESQRQIRDSEEKSLVGKKFGKLTVIEENFSGKRGVRICICTCECKVEKNITCAASNLKSGHTKSCGCLKKVKRKCTNRKTKHGHAKTNSYSPEYRSFRKMKTRCTSKRAEFKNYENISIDPEWLGKDGFINFFKHVGPKPSPEYTLDRINPTGNYEPGNVRWATKRQQEQNKKCSKTYELNGVIWNITEYCRTHDLNVRTIYKRLKTQSFAEAISKPAGKWTEYHPTKDQLESAALARKKKINNFNRHEDTLTFEEWKQVLERHNYKCAYFDNCRHSEETGHIMTLDHIIPISNGGFHCKENVQPLCKSCNSSKGTKDKPLPIEQRNGGRGSLIK